MSPGTLPCPPDWPCCYKRQGIRPLGLTTGHFAPGNGQSKRNGLSQVATAMADVVPFSTTSSMAQPRNHTSGLSSSMKGEALLALWLGLAAIAIIALIVILGYYLSKKSVEPGTRLESIELEHGGMYVFHFNNGSFYSQGTVPTERSNLSDYLHDPEVMSQATSQTMSQVTSQMTSQISSQMTSHVTSQIISCDRCSLPSQPEREAETCSGEQYGHTVSRVNSNVSIKGNSPVVSALDLCPTANGIIPRCHNEHITFAQGLMGHNIEADHSTSDGVGDITNEVLQSFDSNERLLSPSGSTFR